MKNTRTHVIAALAALAATFAVLAGTAIALSGTLAPLLYRTLGEHGTAPAVTASLLATALAAGVAVGAIVRK